MYFSTKQNNKSKAKQKSESKLNKMKENKIKAFQVNGGKCIVSYKRSWIPVKIKQSEVKWNARKCFKTAVLLFIYLNAHTHTKKTFVCQISHMVQPNKMKPENIS